MPHCLDTHEDYWPGEEPRRCRSKCSHEPPQADPPPAKTKNGLQLTDDHREALGIAYVAVLMAGKLLQKDEIDTKKYADLILDLLKQTHE